MEECPHPDEAQRTQFAEQVGLEPKQIRFWFQNKRTLLKVFSFHLYNHSKFIHVQFRILSTND